MTNLSVLSVQEGWGKQPNLNYSYCTSASIGTVRETMFAAWLNVDHTLSIPQQGDFLIDEQYLFEIGGKNKSFQQIKDINHSYVVADDIEIGFGAKDSTLVIWFFVLIIQF